MSRWLILGLEICKRVRRIEVICHFSSLARNQSIFVIRECVYLVRKRLLQTSIQGALECLFAVAS